jgi:hypothetical protein
MLPTYIRSPADFAQAVTIGATTESLVLEFKAEINTRNPQKDVVQREFGCDVAQFANSDGGCLLIGVEEQLDPATNLKRAIGIKTVAKPDDLTKWLEQAIVKYLVPSTFSHEILPIQLAGGMVLAVNIFPSQHAVYLWDRDEHTIEVLRRTNHGKEWMNPDELERHIMDGSRAARIRIAEVVAASTNRLVELVGGVFARNPDLYRVDLDTPIQMGALGPRAFEISVSINMKSFNLQVPYEVLRAAWLGPSGQTMLMLDVRTVWNSKDVTLIPYEA